MSEVIPDSPAALVTLAAIHGGDPVRARSVIGRAVRDGGDALFAPGTRCCPAGSRCRTGNWLRPPRMSPSAGAGPLHRRDALWAAALQTAIARRSGDTGALQKHWYAGHGSARRVLRRPVRAAAVGRIVGRRRPHAPGRPAATHPGSGVRPAGIAGQPGFVVGPAALGRRARRNPGQLAGVGRAARAGARLRRRAAARSRGRSRVPAGLASGAGQPGRRRRGHRGGPLAVAVSGSPRTRPGWPARPRCRHPTAGCPGAMLQLARDLKLGAAQPTCPS